jgi:Ca2+-binding RTX toxin-like protein
MSRWMIEKSGTGIEKSGTGIEKSGTGIEKSGTGIEKSGTGIEKSGTGIRKGLFALSMAAVVLSSQVSASGIAPEGVMSLYVEKGQVTVSWYFEGALYTGSAYQEGTYASTGITNQTLVVGGGTGVKVVGGGTGAKVVGGGTSTDVVGGGTGARVVGGGTGARVVGGGTGSRVVGGGTGSLVVGGGTGSKSITVATNLQFEITLGCQSATVYVLDSNYSEIVSFDDVSVMGNTGLCQSDDDEIIPWVEENTHL